MAEVVTSRPQPGRRGVGTVGVALVLAGVSVNAYLALVARNVSSRDYVYFSAFWSLSLLVGFGMFLPIEQELAHRLSLRRGWHEIRAMAIVAGGLLALELVFVAATVPLLLTALGREGATVAALATLCVISAGQFLLRGYLIGTGRLGRYALVLATDSVLRVGFAALLAATTRAGSSGFAWTMVAAIGVSHVPLLVVVLRKEALHADTADPGPVQPYAIPVLHLLVGSIGAQLLLNGLPVLVAVESRHDATHAASFQAAFQLVRIPLFLAVPVQSTILPSLIARFSSETPSAVARALGRFVALVSATATLGVVLAAAVGPEILRLVYGPRYAFGRWGLAVLTLGVVLYLTLVVFTQALIASKRTLGVARSWLIGAAVAGLVFAASSDPVSGAQWAFLSGTAGGCALGFAQLAAWTRRSAREGA